jgi:pilus assembly protein CpaC
MFAKLFLVFFLGILPGSLLLAETPSAGNAPPAASASPPSPDVGATAPTLPTSTPDSSAAEAKPEGEDKAAPKAPSIADEVKPVQAETRELTLATGVERVLEFPFDIGPISVGSSDNLFSFQRISEGDRVRKLRLVPLKAGYTSMTISDGNSVPRITYMVRVTREDLGEVISQLQDLLGDIEGLKIRAVGGTIVLDGEILLPKDMVRIIRVLDAIKDRDPNKKEVPIKNLATISKVTMNILAERIEREIGSPEITARVINNVLFLEGTAEREFEADRAVQIARSYLPEAFVEKAKGEGGEVRPKEKGGIAGGLPAIVDMMSVRPPAANPPAQDIKITMNYVELNNEYDKSFSFSWKPLASDQSQVKFDSTVGELTSNLVATISGLIPKLNYERSHGHARVLKQETVIVKDRADTPAVIQNSINFYIRQVDANGVPSLQPVPVENVTKVKAATIPGSDSIDLGIQISLNALLGNNSGSPVIAKNTLQTQVTIKNGDSAALGGYGIDQSLANYNREPGTNNQIAALQSNNSGSSTALVNLDRSKGYQHNKNQYIIFVTPEVIRTASAGTEEMSRKFRLNAGEK